MSRETLFQVRNGKEHFFLNRLQGKLQWMRWSKRDLYAYIYFLFKQGQLCFSVYNAKKGVRINKNTLSRSCFYYDGDGFIP